MFDHQSQLAYQLSATSDSDNDAYSTSIYDLNEEPKTVMASCRSVKALG